MSAALRRLDSSSRSQRDCALLTAGVGFAHAVLFLLSYWLLTSAPGARASDEELVAFYGSEKRRELMLVGLYVMPFAGIAFLWFSVALRAWVRASSPVKSELLSGMQLISGILYVALFFAAAAAFSVMAVGMEFSHAPLDPMVARLFPQYGGTLMLVFAMRMAAMFVFMTSRIAKIAGVLPRWFTRVGQLVGLVLLLSSTFSRVLVLILPLWLLVLCVLLLGRARSIPTNAGGEARA